MADPAQCHGRWPAEPDAVGLRSGEALAGAVDDEFADELDQGGEDVEHEPPAGGGGVEILVQRGEPDPALAQTTNQGQQILQVRQAGLESTSHCVTSDYQLIGLAPSAS